VHTGFWWGNLSERGNLEDAYSVLVERFERKR